MKKILFILSLLLLNVFVVAAQNEEVPTFLELKQLVPLVSTCDDVKKILKIDDCSSLWIRKKYKDFSVSIAVSIAEPCQANKIYGGRWNVPKGTVLDLSIFLHVGMPLSEYEDKLKENLKEYKKTEVNDLPGFYDYENEEKGIVISTTPTEYITGIFLYPQKSKGLGCEKKTNIKTPKDF